MKNIRSHVIIGSNHKKTTNITQKPNNIYKKHSIVRYYVAITPLFWYAKTIKEYGSSYIFENMAQMFLPSTVNTGL